MKDHLQDEMRMAHDELNKYQVSYDDEIRKWKQERTDLIVKT